MPCSPRAVPAVLAGLLLTAGGCAQQPATAGVALTAVPVITDDSLADLLTRALEADASLDPADALYEAEAEVVANGERRFVPPRYAGIEPGGAVAVASSRVEFRGAIAWATVEYRWLSTSLARAAEGRGTFVLVPDTSGAWRIRHAHSSSPAPGPALPPPAPRDDDTTGVGRP